MAGNLTRINNNQITDAVSGNTQYGINANTKVQQYSVTSTLLANNLTYGSDLTITGNLSVTGNVTAIDTTNTTIEDPLLLLASNQTGSPTVDIGYIGQRGTSNNIAFVWDESFKSFVTVYTDSGAGDNTNINILSYADFITANANVTGNLLAVNVSLSGNVISDLNVTGTTTSNVIVSVNDVSALGNIVTNNTVNTGNLSLSGVVISDLSVNGNVSATGNVIAANFSTSGSGGNISGANVISSISVTATGNIGAGQYLFGNGYYITDINPANVAVTKITNGNSYANIATADANLVVAIGTNSNIVATFYDDGVDFGGDISSVGNVYANAGLYGNTLSLSGNITSDLNVSGNIIPSTDNVYTLGNATNTWSAGYFSPNTLYIGTVKLGANNAANVATINNQVIPVYTNGNLDLSATGNIAAGNTFNSVNLSLSGNVISPLNVTGTVTAQYVVATIDVSSLGNVVAYDTVNSNNLSLSGNVISPLNVTGTATAQYVVATNDVSALGNVVAYNSINANNASLSGNVISDLNVTGNITGQNILTYGLVSAFGTATVGNLLTVGTVSATGNLVGGNVNSGNDISAFGNVYSNYVFAMNDLSAGGNVNTNNTFNGNALTGNTLTISSTYGGLFFSVNGNINAGNTYITTLVNPVNPQDAATKAYVDATSNGLQVKASSNTATTGNIFATTGQTYTYNNGTNGVGATITFNAPGNVTIDNVLLTSGQRVLIKNEPLANVTDGTTPSAAYNGIYTVTTAGSPGTQLVLTRATDDDTPGLMYSAYTFIVGSSTSTNQNTGWSSTNTPTSPGDPIVVGTTFYIWTEFSQAGSYTGGNAISVSAGVISALYDGSTIGVNGNNQLYIPPNAPLTTPNIGDATGNSLSVVGSLSGNIITVTTASITGNIYSANITTVNISITGNIKDSVNVDNSVIANNFFATNVISAGGNIIAYDTVNSNNLSLSGNVISPLNVTGTATAQYVVATNDVSALGNVVAANFTTTGPQGNISGANVISGITLTASGNVYGQYLVTPNTTINSGVFTTGVVSATGNIQTANYLIGNGYYITDINPANVAVSLISNGNSYANIATYNGNLVVAIGASANTVATFYDNGVNFGGDISTVGNVSVGSGNILDSANTGIQLYSANIAQLNYSNTGLVTADSTGILLQTGSYVFTLSTTGDISAPGAFSALGNISTSNNIITTGLVTATGNVYGGNAVIATDISAGGNILTSGYVSASGNIQSGTTLLVDTTTSSVSLGANVQETTGATLAINATDSMLIPVGNTAQRPVTPATGMLRYNSTLSECEVWNGAAWVTVGGSTFTVIQNEQFNGDGSTTTFTLASSQTTDSCIVTINGVVQIPTTAYSVSGVYPSCVLTFTEAPEVGDTIDVREITTTVTVTAISNSSGNSVVSVQETTGEVDITGNLVAQLNPAAPSLATNSTMSFQLVNNTTLKILVRGTDGTTRSANITLA